MRFGVCGGPEIADDIYEAGFDFCEWSVGNALKPRQSTEEFAVARDAMASARVVFPAVNCFIPGDLKITGPEVDSESLRAYVATCMERAEKTDIEVVVFGSGTARSVPQGFDRKVAHDQLVSFARMAAATGQDHGVEIVVEPLNKDDCNVLTTVAECGELVQEVDHPGCGLLVDAYHHMRDEDSFENIAEYGHLLGHVHIATVDNRMAPGLEECDFEKFFDALAAAGYDGRMSIEAQIPDPEVDLPKAKDVLRSYVE